MQDIPVRFAIAALADVTTGLAALVPQVPSVPVGLTLPVPRVVDETTSAWMARGTLPTERELAAGPLLAVYANLAHGADDATPELPWARCPVSFAFVGRSVDAHTLLAQARYVESAVTRSLLAAFPAPRLTVQGVELKRPDPADFVRGKRMEPWGDALCVQELIVGFQVLDAWTFNLI
jgi:hypothetical protein